MRELRERTDGIQTKAAIRQEALRLFLRNGFQETTLEEIAQAAAVSPGDLLNIYPSKTAIVMQDDLDALVLAAFNAQPPGIDPVAAFRNALRNVLSDLAPEQSVMVRQRALVIRNDAELRAALLTQFGGMVDRVAEVVAARVGPGPTTLAVRDLAGAFVCLIMSITLSASGEPLVDLIKRSDEALAQSACIYGMGRSGGRSDHLPARDARLPVRSRGGSRPLPIAQGTRNHAGPARLRFVRQQASPSAR